MTKDDNQNNQEIPGMNLDTKYNSKKDIIPQNTEKAKKDFEKTKKDLEKLKAFILKKYPFTHAIGVLPPQSIKFFISEEEVPKETEKLVHLYMVVPEEKFKEIPKIKQEIVKELERLKQKVWVQIKTPVDIWEICTDSKFELYSAIAMSFPLYDKEFLNFLRVAEIHKSLVLQKFEKYVVSYVIGGSVVRGQATKDSDLDVFIIINDTDVKRMPRLELLERLRGIIHQYISEAYALAGMKRNVLNVQVYLLTDFWQSVKDAHPVMFTFIRDGIPIYDRGTFMPWKALLKMGKLKPSPEAIDMFMKTADKTDQMIKNRLIDAMVDLYYKVLNPSQALIMLSGSPPPTHKETPKLMEDIFVKKEKILKKSEVEVLAKLVKMFRDYEHNPKMTVKGAEIDKLFKDSDVYIARLKELRKDIEKRSQEKIIEQLYHDVFELLKNIIGKKSQETTIKEFDEKFVKAGKFTNQHLRAIRSVISARSEFKKGKSSSHKIDEARKNTTMLLNDLIDYAQRSDLVNVEKGRMVLKYKENGKDQVAELLICKGQSFLFKKAGIQKITDKIQDSNMNEVSGAIEQKKQGKSIEVDQKIFDLLKQELGNFQIIL